MCHHIEDPTFDATAGGDQPARAGAAASTARRAYPPTACRTATGGCASSPTRPRSTEIALDRQACAARAWRSSRCPTRAGDRSRRPRRLRRSRSIPDLELEDFSASAAAARSADEFCLQGHLLVRTFMMAIAERWGDDAAREIAAPPMGRHRRARRRACRRGDGHRRRRSRTRSPSSFSSTRPSTRAPTSTCTSSTRATGSAAGSATAPRSPRTTPTPGSRCSADEPHRALDAIARAVNPRARMRALRRPRARVGVVGHDRPRCGAGARAARGRADEAQQGGDVPLRVATAPSRGEAQLNPVAGTSRIALALAARMVDDGSPGSGGGATLLSRAAGVLCRPPRLLRPITHPGPHGPRSPCSCSRSPCSRSRSSRTTRSAGRWPRWSTSST